MPDETAKLNAIAYFLTEVLNSDYSLQVRKEEMLRVGKKMCNGFPEWSDIWGVALKPIDEIRWNELHELIQKV